MPSLAQRSIAELVGTFLLVFLGSSAAVVNPFPDARYGIMGAALIHAFTLAIAVSATMNISGGNLNPAVTLGLLSIRRISMRDAFVYIASQIAGALLAAVMVRAIMPSNTGRIYAYGTPVIASQITFGQAVAIEAVLTFLLASAVMGTCVSVRAPKIGGFGVGLSLIPAIMIGGPLTGAALNPARAFGPAVINGVMTGQAVWWIGPIVGAIVAMQLWDKVILRDVTAESA